MSASGTQLSPQPAIDTTDPNSQKPLRSRSALAQLVHALNQPLTGLQCALELSLAAPRQPEIYARTIHEGVELTGRMRELVHAIREVLDVQDNTILPGEPFPPQHVVAEVLRELLPVAEMRRLRLSFRHEAEWESGVTVVCDRGCFEWLMFRLIDSVLSLATEGTEVGFRATREQAELQLLICWTQPESMPGCAVSQAELGLLIVQGGCEQLRGRWERRRSGESQTCTVRLPLIFGKLCHEASRGTK